ncbi:hypothetical protein I317_07682 [Kwoniella heveanensis CBS 569]|nr:hypothetical protein I317_07682 [Kwoniella heveanensis CBS 569]
MFEEIIQALCLVASLSAKWNAYIFLRLLPLGERFLPIIYTASAIYVVSFVLLRWASPPKRSKRIGALLALLCGLPSPSTPLCSLLGAVITLLAPVFSTDFVHRARYLNREADLSFSRIGWVTESTAQVLIRSPFNDQGVGLSYWAEGSQEVLHTKPTNTGAATDHTAAITLRDFEPGTQYHYNSSHQHSGSFYTRLHDERKSFSLLSTSCQKPGWPYNPLAHPLAIRGLTHLDKTIQEMKQKPEAMLFLGDFIYSDLPYPTSEYTSSYYRQLYRQVYASPSWTPLLRSIPWLHMFDDHEIINDFAPVGDMSGMFKTAIEPFMNYQQVVNPPPINVKQPTYFSFDIGDVAFFMLDNRSFRSQQPVRPGANSTAGHGVRTMLGSEQLAEVKRWIKKEGQSRLDTSTRGRRSWNFLWEAGGAVIISGDRHEHAATLFPPSASSPWPTSSAVTEFSTSPLSFFHQPWKREYVPHPPTDIPIHHQWRGDSRFGVFDFDTFGPQPKVHFKLIVDGAESWSYTWEKCRGADVPKIWRG